MGSGETRVRRRLWLAVAAVVALGGAPAGHAALGGLLGSADPAALPQPALTGDELGIGLDLDGDDGDIGVEAEVGDVGVEVDTNGGEVSVGDVGVEVDTGGGDVTVGVGAGEAVSAEATVGDSGVSVVVQPPAPGPPVQPGAEPTAPRPLPEPATMPRPGEGARPQPDTPPGPAPTPSGSATTPGTPGPILAVPAGRPEPDGSVTTRSPAVDGVPGQKVAAPAGTIAPPVTTGAAPPQDARGSPDRDRDEISAAAPATPTQRDPSSPFKLGLGPGGGVLGGLALLLFIFIPAGVLLLSAVPGRAGPPGVGRSIVEERVTIIGVAVAMWVGVAVVLLLDRR